MQWWVCGEAHGLNEPAGSSFRQDRLFPPWGKHGLLLLITGKRIVLLENKPYIG
jgi:hypothetical protein